MSIVRLQMENIKKIKAVEIKPDGNMVVLTGKNGSGKSSVLDAISWAFEGVAKIQNKPIRHGQNKGWIKIELGDYTIERTFKNDEHGEYTSRLLVTSADGAEYKSPQALLEKCFNSLSFNPLQFSTADTKQQLTMLESLVPGFNFEVSRLKEKTAYDERTVANRNAKDSSLKHVSFKDVPVPEPEVVDVKALTDRMANASKKNVEIENNKKSFSDNWETNVTKPLAELQAHNMAANKTFEEAKAVWERAVQAYETAGNQSVVLGEKIAAYELNTVMPTWPELENVDSIKADLDNATAKNELHDRWKQKKRAKDDIEAFEKQSADLTTEIERLQKERFNAIALAKLPAGLAFDSNGVTLNGLPFEQASSAEQLEASVGIAMAANSELKVIRIQDGSLLDSDGMALISRMADQNGCQVWIERVGTGEVGFELVDGELKQ